MRQQLYTNLTDQLSPLPFQVVGITVVFGGNLHIPQDTRDLSKVGGYYWAVGISLNEFLKLIHRGEKL